MRSKEFPNAPLERIAKKASGMRVSKSAVKALRNYVLDSAEERGKEIVQLARHAGRKTIMKEDVMLAIKKQP